MNAEKPPRGAGRTALLVLAVSQGSLAAMWAARGLVEETGGWLDWAMMLLSAGVAVYVLVRRHRLPR